MGKSWKSSKAHLHPTPSFWPRFHRVQNLRIPLCPPTTKLVESYQGPDAHPRSRHSGLSFIESRISVFVCPSSSNRGTIERPQAVILDSVSSSPESQYLCALPAKTKQSDGTRHESYTPLRSRASTESCQSPKSVDNSPTSSNHSANK